MRAAAQRTAGALASPAQPSRVRAADLAWHAMPVGAVLAALETDRRGLTAIEAADRLARDGANEIADRTARSRYAILIGQLSSPMVLVLLAGAAIAAILGEHRDTIGILAIVAANAAIGFAHELRAERRIAALKRLAAPVACVRRDGTTSEIDARRLVAGDVIVLRAGHVVPADARLIDALAFRVQESALTGESAPVDKRPGAVLAPTTVLAERCTMVYLGTVVAAGHADAVVTAAGMHTELGAIAALSHRTPRTPTPLERRLTDVGRRLAIAALVIVAVVFPLGLLRGVPAALMLRTAISMAAAAIPEGLPAVLTIALAFGAERMLRRRTLIRQLLAVETLGSVTVICSDKTGTLTENRMRVETIILPSTDDGTARGLLLMGVALCNDAIESAADPTETALLTAAIDHGLSPSELARALPRVAEFPFDADRRRMTTIHAVRTRPEAPESFRFALDLIAGVRTESIAFTKGAVQNVLDVCGWMLEDGSAVPLSDLTRAHIASTESRLASAGLRLLAVACRTSVPPTADERRAERDLVFLGIVGLADPPREAAADSIAKCRAAGIRAVMITGDHPDTARYVARAVGIDHDRIVTGQEVAAASPETLMHLADAADVFARVSPEEKLRIVAALQARGHVVAMTGDGVNDAPALRKADIGIAMGVTGTDASRATADAVLLDDDFATIVAAVEEGRVVFDNLRKFMRFMLTTNVAELLVMLIGPLAGMPLPLLPLQILWINLVTDGPSAIALAIEPAERDVMRRRPNTLASLAGADSLRDIAAIGLPIALASLGAGAWYWSFGSDRWQTMVFTTLTLSQLTTVLAMRSSRESYFKLPAWSNVPLVGAVMAGVVAQAAVIYLPSAQMLFNTRPLSPTDAALALVLSSVGFAVVEVLKHRRNRC